MADPTNNRVRIPGAVIFTAILSFISAAFSLAGAVAALLGIMFGNVMGLYDFLSRRIAQVAQVPNFTYGLMFLCIVLFLIFLLLGLFFAAVGTGLLKGKQFAWYAQVTLSVFGLVGFLSGSAFSLTLPVLPLSALLNGAILVLFFRNPIRDFFKV